MIIGKANQFLMEKQSIEVAMALDIQEVFNDELLPNLRSMCLVSIFKTDDLLGGSVQFRAQFIINGSSTPVFEAFLVGMSMPYYNMQKHGMHQSVVIGFAFTAK